MARSFSNTESCACARSLAWRSSTARSAEDFATLQDDLDAYRDLRIDHTTLTNAESAQRDLPARGQHRVSLPDLLIGAGAGQHGADVLHVDRRFDALADIFAFRSIRVS